MLNLNLLFRIKNNNISGIWNHVDVCLEWALKKIENGEIKN